MARSHCTTGEAPGQREGHTSSVVGSDVIVFGGAGLDKEDSSVNLCDLISHALARLPDRMLIAP